MNSIKRRGTCESIVRNVGIIRRGYEKLFTKLDALGADFDVIG